MVHPPCDDEDSLLHVHVQAVVWFRTTRTYEPSLEYRDVGTSFRADNGYVPQAPRAAGPLPRAARDATMHAEELMPRLAIRSYRASWYPGSNRAQLALQAEDGSAREVPVETAAELGVLLALLAASPVYLEDDGSIVHEGTVGPPTSPPRGAA